MTVKFPLTVPVRLHEFLQSVEPLLLLRLPRKTEVGPPVITRYMENRGILASIDREAVLLQFITQTKSYLYLIKNDFPPA